MFLFSKDCSKGFILLKLPKHQIKHTFPVLHPPSLKHSNCFPTPLHSNQTCTWCVMHGTPFCKDFGMPVVKGHPKVKLPWATQAVQMSGSETFCLATFCQMSLLSFSQRVCGETIALWSAWDFWFAKKYFNQWFIWYMSFTSKQHNWTVCHFYFSQFLKLFPKKCLWRKKTGCKANLLSKVRCLPFFNGHLAAYLFSKIIPVMEFATL